MTSFNVFRGRKVVITGGLGFIGSALARRLVGLDAEVTLIDSLIPEYGGNLANIRDIRNSLTVNVSDVRDKYSLHYLVSDADYLFNLAGQTSHLDSMQDPFADLEINCESQLAILEFCRRENPNVRIVFASTRQIYGRPKYLPVDEQHLVQPVDVNGINKMAGEWYHILYQNVYGIPATALRLTNTYGPGMRIKDSRQTFLGVWIRSVLVEEPIVVWGGTQLRDFTYVDDAVEAFLLSAVSDRAPGEVFNLGGMPAVSLVELAKLLIDVAGQGHYEVRDFPPDRKQIDIGDYYADISKVSEVLSWRPAVGLREGLTRTVEYYLTRLSDYL